MEGSADRKEARRPMNSFFIFCKRHRSMVQSKHPNLDNRSISRILGDLWANLDKGEKQQYKVTAKQYKDAFMKANPGYKWHSYDKSTLLLNPANFRDTQSIPAAKTADPSNNAYKTLNKDCLTCYKSCPSNGNNMNLLMMAIDENTTSGCCHLPQSEIKEEYSGIPADSSNMSMLHAKISWLSKINLKPDPHIAELRLYQNWYFEHKGVPANLYGSLSGCSDQQCPVKKSPSSPPPPPPPPLPSNLPSSQITVATTTTTATTIITTTAAAAVAAPTTTTTTTVLQAVTTPPPLPPPPPQLTKDCNESDECKSHPSDGSVDADVAALLDCPLSVECPLKDSGIPTRKSKRRNKGAIYKNLIASGALPASRERLAEIQATYKVTSDDCNMYNYHQHRQQQHHQSHEQTGRKLQRTMSESDSHQDKRYKTGDFDLEAKIATLPACSMETVGRSRKNSGKQKTGSESSRQTSISCTTDTLKTGMLIAPPHRRRPCIYPPIVGSRKRKQPRDGILRILPLSKEYKHPLANVMKIPLATFFIHPSMKSYQDLQLNSKPDGQDPIISDSTSEEGTVVASAAAASVKTGDRNSAALSQTLTINTNCSTQSEPEADRERFQPRLTQEFQQPTCASDAPLTTATCSETEVGGGLAASQSQQTIHRVNPTPLRAECNNFPDHNSSNCCNSSSSSNSSSPSITCNNNNNNDNNVISYNNSNNNNDGDSENVKGSYTTTTTTNFTNTIISTKNNNNNNSNNSYNISFNNNDNINNTTITTTTINTTTTTTTINNNTTTTTINTTTNNNNNHHNNHNNDISKSSATCVDTNTCTGDNMGNPSCPNSVEVTPNLHVTGELKITTLEDAPQKHAKLSENPDFKIWISNLAEAAERSGQIPVC
ncbi:dual specificity protein kinase splA-like [Argonauta hians]